MAQNPYGVGPGSSSDQSPIPNPALGEGAVDRDGDGVADTLYVDLDGDGRIDGALFDHNQDGVIDEGNFDMDGDGIVDTVMIDVDGDGVADVMGVDYDQDATPTRSTHSNPTPDRRGPPTRPT